MAGFEISFGNMAFTILTKEIDLKALLQKLFYFQGNLIFTSLFIFLAEFKDRNISILLIIISGGHGSLPEYIYLLFKNV